MKDANAAQGTLQTVIKDSCHCLKRSFHAELEVNHNIGNARCFSVFSLSQLLREISCYGEIDFTF